MTRMNMNNSIDSSKKAFCILAAFSTLYFLAMNISFICDISRDLDLWLRVSIIFIVLIVPLVNLKNHHTHNKLFVISKNLKNKLRLLYEISFWYLILTFIVFLLSDFVGNDYFEANKFTIVTIVLSCMGFYLSEYILFSLMLGRTNKKINFKTE